LSNFYQLALKNKVFIGITTYRAYLPDGSEVKRVKENSKHVGKVLEGLVSEKPTSRVGSLQVFMAVLLAAIMAITVMPMNAVADDVPVLKGTQHPPLGLSD